jgi:hypothetical protein
MVNIMSSVNGMLFVLVCNIFIHTPLLTKLQSLNHIIFIHF